MGFVCIMPEDMITVDQNYSQAASNYARQREAILKQLDAQTNQSGEDFISKLGENFKNNMRQKLENPDTLQQNRYETILKYIYNAAEVSAKSIVEDNLAELDSIKNEILKLQQLTESDIIMEKEQINKEIENIISNFAQQMNMNQLFDKYLPQVLSKENQQLSGAQLLGYCKSIFKQEIYQRLQLDDVNKVVKRHPAIILGYIREDALTKAAQEAMDEFHLSSAKAQTVGGKQTAIDVLLSLTGGSTKITEDNLNDLLDSLDAFSSFTTEGDSQYENDQFLGIQSKPWNFYRRDKWNFMSIGSRAGLLKGFNESVNGINLDNEYAWHRGVLYLSQNLTTVMGANTVMYATGESIIWTDQLLEDMISRWHRYFAFDVDSKHQLTSHIILAEHYG